ncbi:MAG: hypothetical protein ACKO4V_07875 [Planctomycetota bacterium]
MPRVLIWDLPVRIFHLVFASGITTAAVIALVLGDDGSISPHRVRSSKTASGFREDAGPKWRGFQPFQAVWGGC